MKKFIYILLSLLPIIGNTQHSFAPVGAEWYFTQPFGSPYGDVSLARVIGDTLINNKYSTIVQSNWGNSSIFLDSLQVDYIHEDGDKVFYWYNDSFRLYFDFSVEKGDTLEVDMRLVKKYDTNFVAIRDVESVRLYVRDVHWIDYQGDNLKSFNLEVVENLPLVVPNFSIAEKLGHTKDFFMSWHPFDTIWGWTTSHDPWLRCYKDSSSTIKLGAWASYDLPCDTTGHINTALLSLTELERNEYHIYPQPATQQITIQGVNSNTAWRFISATGQVVKSGIGKNINVEALPRGLCILEIQGEHPSSHKVILE